MIQNTEKSKEVLKVEQAVSQDKARLDEAKRKDSQKKARIREQTQVYDGRYHS